MRKKPALFFQSLFIFTVLFSVSVSADEFAKKIEELEKKQNLAHTMADSARKLGYEESHVIILEAKEIWKTANLEKTALKEKMTEKKFTFHVFDTSNLTPDEFNKILSGTPLYGWGDSFYQLEQNYRINGLFALSVAQNESSFGKYISSRRKNNPFGMGNKSFHSFEDAIFYFGQLMNESYYKDKSIESIAKVYCPYSHTAWSSSVKSFMKTNWNKIN